MLDLRGLVPATVLPMDTAGAIDEAGLRRYLRWLAGQGPIALAVNVDTGEGQHLTHDERLRVLDIARSEVSVPIIAGLAGPSTDQAVNQARDFKAAGADALLVFPIPAYLSEPLDPRVPVEYHKAVAGVGLPLIVFQLQPALGGVLYAPATLSRLLQVEGVAAIKEASFDRQRCRDVVDLAGSLARPVTVLSGNDNFILESFELGCEGALIGFGAIMTAEQVTMIDAWRDGRVEEARALAGRIQRVADAVFAPPVGDYRARLKECLVILGVLDNAHVRRPQLDLAAADRAALRELIVEVGLVDGGNRPM